MKSSAVALAALVVSGCATAGAPNEVGVDASHVDAPHGTDAAIDGPPGIDAPTADAPHGTGTHLVINEIDYDNVSTDSAEFVEIFNPTGGSVSLATMKIMLVNGTNGTVYGTVDLSSKGSIAAGGYLVLGNAAVTVASGGVRLDPGWTTNAIQNGNPDGIALVDTSGPSLVDALSYGGAITTATLTGFPGPVSLVEGTVLASTVIDSNMTVGSLCRSPNGADTDDANTDWKFCSTLSAGAANP